MQKTVPTHWFIKYKIYHIPFWFVYHFVWWSVAVGSPVKVVGIIFSTPYAVKYIFFVVFQAMAVYFNLYFLMPEHLEKSRYATYISLLLATILVASVCIASGYYVTAYVSHQTLQQAFGKDVGSYFFFSEALPSTIASTTLAMSIKLAKNWIRSKRKQQLLEKEKLESELNFLKYQFNPHFLFNTINSIFFLIHKNPDKASASLAKFSELIRYQLYECNEEQIPLSREINYIENFIELEKLRQNSHVEICFETDQAGTKNQGIAPFILMTFVENAFKHVSKDSNKQNWIKIIIAIKGQQLHFSSTNSISSLPVNDVIRYGGIGLKNVQRRLDLIYSGNYLLDIQKNENSFAINLQLTLPEFVNKEPIRIAEQQFILR
jgi:two-component system, LytTR family, sensor kinase